MTIEKLTDEERERLSYGGHVRAPDAWKALRIIDAQQTALTEALERAEADNAALRAERDETLDRCQQLTEAAQSLERDCACLRAEVERLRAECQEWNDELDARVEEGCADLKARLAAAEAARAGASQDAETELAARDAAESRLAAAEALLQKALDHANEWPDPDNGKYRRALAAFLSTATQPAASVTTCTPGEKSCNPIDVRVITDADPAAPCTAEERAVLDAAKLLDTHELQDLEDLGTEAHQALREAIVAFRAAKEKP